MRRSAECALFRCVERNGVSTSTGLGVRVASAGSGLAGCDPRTYLALGHPAVPVGTHPDPLGAWPARDAQGRILPLGGERRIDAWQAVTATATRRAQGGLRLEAQRPWRGSRAPVVVLTDRRILVHGGVGDETAHVALERLVSARADLRRRRGAVTLETLLHCRESGASGVLELRLELPPRRAIALVHAIAGAHRGRWSACDLPAAVAAAVAGARPRRATRVLRYDAALHMPLGLTDAIRGPGATPDVPQRLRTRWPEGAQAACAG